jgi:hypothetical protein
MKKLIFVLSLLSLFAYGCNRDEAQSNQSGAGTGMQQEESRGMDQQVPSQDTSVPAQNMDQGTMDSETDPSATE